MPRLYNKQLTFICAIIILVTTFLGCAETDKVEPKLSSLWDKSFNACGINCHSPDASDGTENGPDLTSKDNFFNDLVNKNATDYPDWLKPDGCDHINFITPGDANESTTAASLVLSIFDTLSEANGGCTAAYNLHEVTKITITDKDIETAFIQWINNGANND